MATEPDPRPWENLEQLAKEGDQQQLEQFIESLPAGEAARAISRLDADEQTKVLTTIDPEQAADLLGECPPAQASDLIEQLPPTEAAAIIAELPSDLQADLITTLSQADAEAILREMGPDEAAETRKLASYRPDEAGGLMITEFLAYRETVTAGDVLDDMYRNSEKYGDYDIQYAYVLSPFGDLVGVLRLRDLLLTPRHKPIADIMIRKPLSVNVHTRVDELRRWFDSYGFIGVPVLDRGGKLVGVLRRRDVEAAAGERAESDFLKSLGIVGGEELRSMPVRVRATRRLSWLSINIVLNICAASVIAMYQDTLAAVIALAVFLPIISDMSGCAGFQAVAVSMRELTLGMIRPNELLRVLGKEVIVGVINGVVLGLLITALGFLWKGNPYLGLVAGAALAVNTIVAVCVGGIIPLILKMMHRDPALASGPILTTITDMCGFFFVLSFASIMLPKLTE